MFFKLARTSICVGIIFVQMPNHLGLLAILCFAGGFIYISLIPPGRPQKPARVNVWENHRQRQLPPSAWLLACITAYHVCTRPLYMPVVLVPATGVCVAIVVSRLFNPTLLGMGFVALLTSVIARETALITTRK